LYSGIASESRQLFKRVYVAPLNLHGPEWAVCFVARASGCCQALGVVPLYNSFWATVPYFQNIFAERVVMPISRGKLFHMSLKNDLTISVSHSCFTQRYIKHTFGGVSS